MDIRLTSDGWKSLNINPLRVDSLRVDNLGNVYMHASMGDGLSTTWCWRAVTTPALKDFIRTIGVGDHRVMIAWS